ncbi:MAG: NAD(P)H-hydrate epimerase [Chloroflexi bacterium]|nr:MAG: NAD(P)H-hydrate epimerase [Chloroflexota bacterium]MBL1196058.1 NAD(P)H-hydrate epimerase [Chloroflexota bacterium]NOH13352.1 NAD(P)H-hydrate epimerase [Chloroflexota bacterium]
MKATLFRSNNGIPIPAVSEEEMREVDRIAVEDFGLGILQMMENAGRNLALACLEMLGADQHEITILAGTGGNGGGGISCARHLHNRGHKINLVLTKDAQELGRAAAAQMNILHHAGVTPADTSQSEELIEQADLIVDALIGYSLNGAPRGRIAELIEKANARAKRILSLDIPSGMDSTTGETPGLVINPESTMTLALPKTGLANPAAGKITLADIGIPEAVYHPLHIQFDAFWGDQYRIDLNREEE